ncbi:carboxylate-amine ligase [Kineococcus sp. SYSU DK003]|uniref:carboxylate-amine ligase n=1 Tax=Kineococcus sp. SYSU DK003 TaxID=3383124 RepID=UPI003D7D172C
MEQEFHVVDAVSLRLLDSSPLNAEALAGRLGPGITAEIASAQLETATGICRTLGQVRAEVVAGRREAAAAAARYDATILPAATHPFARWDEQHLTLRPRYVGLLERWGLLALQQNICGCHVHVGVPSLQEAVQVLDRVRPWLPVLLALTGSSPFHEGSDTGYDSYRTEWFARWPCTGPPEELGSAQAFDTLLADLRRAGVADSVADLYWDARPSDRFPTLEFRIADVCPRVDDVVLHAALCRSLVRVLSARAVAGDPVPRVRPAVLRAARWRAARSGVSDVLLDPQDGAPRPAAEVVRGLLAELRDDLEDAGEFEEVSALVDRVLVDGTSATRQRAALHRSGDLVEAARSVLRDAGRG